MDNLTHGLFGLAVGTLGCVVRRAVRRHRRGAGQQVAGAPEPTQLDATERALLAACVVAAELPDLDTFWPSENEVLQALHAHRGPSHALLAAPVVAGVAVALVRPFFKGAQMAAMFAWAVPAVLLHLLADAWTGWGTRLFLPFSDARLSLDWTLVVDPLVTVPMLIGAVVALVRRRWWRRAILVGALVSSAYVAARVALRAHLIHVVSARYPGAVRVEVFPMPIHPRPWRYAVEVDGQYHVGRVRPFDRPQEQAVHDARMPPLPAVVRDNATVREALAWARLPQVTHEVRDGGEHTVRIADLRYHFGGQPTLAFHFELGADGALQRSEFDRGGSPRELMQRLREQERASDAQE